MPSVYFEYSGNVTPGSTIRSSKYNNDQVAIDTAFEFVEKDIDRSLLFDGVRARSANVIPSPSEESLVMVSPDSVALFPVSTLLNIANQLDDVPAQLVEMEKFAVILQQAETGWIDIKKDTLATKNRKIQAFAAGASVNLTLTPMNINDTLIVRNNKASTDMLRLVNAGYLIRGERQEVDETKNITLKPGTTLSMLCTDINVLEIL